MHQLREIHSWLTDMDGVLVHGSTPLPGATELIEHWLTTDTPFLVLTNNSTFTARDLAARLHRSGIPVPEERIWTSAMATADFLKNQPGEKTAFVIGEAGLTMALYEAGFVMTDIDPAFVVLGESLTLSWESLTIATRLILSGSRFVATNPDANGPGTHGVVPATGAVAAMLTAATGREPYIVGKPNPMMFRSAMNRIEAHSESTAMIGDRMDTDMVAGMEAGLHTILVMSGVASKESITKFPYRPNTVLDGVADLVRILKGTDEG
ncbi:HAD-IIA family hydrolase [Nigerium massiliense]|uniref:HAD-IIA family hydrolase n=1 Tax=Nigerium massiliense TaxID=1522317 RepID=UPI00058FA3AA|nr:HAD-IIA family hydrolase [Nigerium massiliense]